NPRPSQGEGLDQLQDMVELVLAGVGVEHFGAEEQADADAVVGAGAGRFHLAVLERDAGVAGLFFENLDEIGSPVASGLEDAVGFCGVHAIKDSRWRRGRRIPPAWTFGDNWVRKWQKLKSAPDRKPGRPRTFARFLSLGAGFP